MEVERDTVSVGEFEFECGESIPDLEVAYEVDGERIHESWEGPVEPEDRFETSEVPDPGSVLDLVWARGTANETILIRVELPE